MVGKVRETKFHEGNEGNFSLRMGDIWTFRTMMGGQPSPFRKQYEQMLNIPE